VPDLPGFVFASTARRCVAWVIDWWLLGVGFLLGALAVEALGSTVPLSPGTQSAILVVWGELLSVVYFVRSWLGPSRATLGQRWLKLQVRNAVDGRPMTAREAIVRWAMLGYPLALVALPLELSLARVLGAALLALASVLLATTVVSRTNQGLHDRAARSLVVQPTGLGSRAVVVGAILISVTGAPLIATAVLDSSGSSGPDIETIAFGTGGSGCTLANVGSSFAPGVPVRVVVEFSPALPAGGTVTVTINVPENGTTRVALGGTIKMAEPTPCVSGTLPPLGAGHYRVEAEASPSTTPPISGEFDVTP